LGRRELEEMQALKFEQTGDSTFAAWEWWFYAEKIRTQRYNLDESALKPYFSLDNVKSGIFQLSNRLWGVSFRPISVPTYHPDCMVYEVLDRDNSHLGVLYFDLFQRDNKRVGAWCSTLRREHYATDGKTRIAPIVTITANFTPPTNEKEPALLNLDETQTLFHEFGHALHQLFSQVHYEGNGGVERDFVELPSQIMENWATEPAMLRFYAKHYVSGEPLSEQLIDQIRRSVKFNQGFATTELLAASLIDMDLHTIEAYQPVNLDDFEKNALYTRRGMLPQIEPRYRYPYFNHIFNGGYAAGYYSYLWAEVLDKDAYQAFVESGDLFNREVAQRFRAEILERGGSADGMTLYRNFRGKEPDQTALMIARGLIELPAADSTDATDASIPMVE
ncbi:MAG: M3 family metallopeptidase, partial [Alistipes sp.]|nr:M3 family metallopeptidase [Alistipes sp.]